MATGGFEFAAWIIYYSVRKASAEWSSDPFGNIHHRGYLYQLPVDLSVLSRLSECIGNLSINGDSGDAYQRN